MSEGREAKIGFKKASVWGTPVACGANDGLLVTSVGLKRKIEQIPDDGLGHAFRVNQDTGKQDVKGNLVGDLRYDGWDALIAMILGGASAPAQQGATAAYRNTLYLTNDVDGLFGTLAVYKGYSVHEHPSLKVMEMEISGEAGQKVVVSLSSQADTINVNTSTGTNNNNTIATVTVPDENNRVLFRHAKFFLSDASGAAFDSSHQIYPSKFSLKFKRGLSADYAANAQNADKVVEPTGNGFPEPILELTFPEYTASGDQYIVDMGNDTHKKLQISFLGAVISGAYYREFSLYAPNWVLEDADVAADKPGKLTQTLTGALLGTATERTGMAGLYNPFKVIVQNTRTTNPLA